MNFNDTTNTIMEFNFCKYVSKKCSVQAPYFHAAAYNTTSCYYLNENALERNNYELIKTKNQTGLRINYYDVRETGIVLRMNLFCDQKAQNITFTNNEVLGNEYIINARTKEICPQIMTNSIFNFFSTFKWVFFVIGIIVGPIELIIGNKIFKTTVFLVI